MRFFSFEGRTPAAVSSDGKRAVAWSGRNSRWYPLDSLNLIRDNWSPEISEADFMLRADAAGADVSMLENSLEKSSPLWLEKK